MWDRYRISLVDYREMLIQQNGVCAICGRPEISTHQGKLRHLSVDHNHTTGTIRGLLCHNCNAMLGYAGDRIDVLMNAGHYLALWKSIDDNKNSNVS